jgi:hypothetical protein
MISCVFSVLQIIIFTAMRKKTRLALYKRRKRYTPKKISHRHPSLQIKKDNGYQHPIKRRRNLNIKVMVQQRYHGPQQINVVDIEDEFHELSEEEYQQLDTFTAELKKFGLWPNFLLFIELVSKQEFPLDNIALLLFLDTVNFFSCKSTTCMKYFPETKRFWKSGYRLFHAKFLYFMGGPKNVGQGEENCGHIDPSTARINFAVPSINIIENFDITDTNTSMSKRMPAGVIDHIVDSIEKSVQVKRFMLCADAKKVTAGIDKQGGDVDMFGFEDGETLKLRQHRLLNEKHFPDRN